ncbi:MAG: hypothetical protein IT330_14540, partial [Anaerolineae bacterium]|nr:hypothetical protein [Anaerolineae bacterium]
MCRLAPRRRHVYHAVTLRCRVRPAVLGRASRPRGAASTCRVRQAYTAAACRLRRRHPLTPVCSPPRIFGNGDLSARISSTPGVRRGKTVLQGHRTNDTDNAPIILVVNDRHAIHHVRERGYVETPNRITSILKGIEPTGLFARIDAQHFPERHIKAVHDSGFVSYVKSVCANVEPKDSIYPYIFPIRNAARRPQDPSLRAGYYCIDTVTPLNRPAYQAARAAVDCTLTAARQILAGERLAYALVRPPGHHAERRVFGGFCYFNSAAVAAHYLSAQGKVVILDIDYHHGNGQQEIFYERADVLTIS